MHRGPLNLKVLRGADIAKMPDTALDLVTAQEVQARVVEEPVADPAVAGVVARLDHLLYMAGVLAGSHRHDGRVGSLACAQLLGEVA